MLQSPFVQPFTSEEEHKDREKHHKEMQTKCKRKTTAIRLARRRERDTLSGVCAAAARQRQLLTAKSSTSCLQLFKMIALIKCAEFNSLYSNVM